VPADSWLHLFGPKLEGGNKKCSFLKKRTKKRLSSRCRLIDAV